MKVEQLFACHRVSEERKVPLATLSFQDNAMYWWTALERERRLHKNPSIEYWNDLRGALRRRHIPPYYNRKSMDKLQGLHQKNLSLEEYWQKMVLYIIRARINEDNHTTISRVLSGLKLEIRNKVKLLPYKDLNDLIQLRIKVEKQSSYFVSYDKEEVQRGEEHIKETSLEPSQNDGRGPSTTTIESPPTCRIEPITRAMARKRDEDWNTATDGRKTYLYMLKDAIAPSVE